MSPMVSIIVPTYNRSRLLERALESAVAQTYSPLEILAVDDGSSDETCRVAERFGAKVRYLRQAHAGCGSAKNTGLEHAAGELITVLDDDDRILPDKIARQVELLDRNRAVGLCATGVLFVDADGVPQQTYQPRPIPSPTRVLQLLIACPFVQSSVMVRRECHDRLGGYQTDFAQDYDLWLRVACEYELAVVPEVLTIQQRHPDQTTAPRHNQRLHAAAGGVLRRFLGRVEPERIVPGAPDEQVRGALVAILLQRRYPDIAMEVIERSPETEARRFWTAVLHLWRKDLQAAREGWTGLDPRRLPPGGRQLYDAASALQQADLADPESPRRRQLASGWQACYRAQLAGFGLAV